MGQDKKKTRGEVSQMKIIENFLKKEDLEDLKGIVLNEGFPWYMNDGVTWPGDGHIQFTHQIYKDDKFTSPYTLGGLDIFKKQLKFEKILRAKFNLLQKTPDIIEHPFHTDLVEPDKDVKTAILYLNTNNGYTKFLNGEKVESIENRLIVFEGGMEHAGSTCTDKRYRAVFNLNYKEGKNNEYY